MNKDQDENTNEELCGLGLHPGGLGKREVTGHSTGVWLSQLQKDNRQAHLRDRWTFFREDSALGP